MEKSIDPIGIFDSGIGGLTVAQAIAKALPLEAITYLGDRARCPYGDRSSAEVARFSLEIGEYLVGLGVKCLVVACNTATAVALPLLREALPIPVVGVIEPGARAAVQASETGRIGVIGTSVTIASHAYRQSIHAISPDAHVVEHACPAFVPLVEAGRFNGPEVEQAVRASLRVFESTGIDCLVLGCTHYPLLSEVIEQVVGPSVKVISSADATAAYVANLLQEKRVANRDASARRYRYLTTGDKQSMKTALNQWFGQAVEEDAITHVALPEAAQRLTQSVRL